MDKIADGYYFMFEIGWFLDLLIPTIVRIKDDSLYFVGSKPCDVKGLRPCCIPAGGEAECKKFLFDDPSLKAFKSIDSLIGINNLDDLKGELEKSLENEEMKEKYLNSKVKRKRKAIIERVVNDYRVLSMIDAE